MLRPNQLNSLCFVFISILQLLLASRESVEPVACANVVAGMGPFFRWPTQNAGMVAPEAVVWNYPVYNSPLHCSFTGKAIQIDIPDSFGMTAGFHLGTSGIPTATDQRFRLARLEIRNPPVSYAGIGQALSHVMEMVLIHRQQNGNLWANVVVPFLVSTDGDAMDIIGPMIDGVKLPSRIGEPGIIMASAVSEMMLSPVFQGASFSGFWGTAPVSGCMNKSIGPENVRYFMRTTTLSIGVDTFAQLSKALQNAPTQEPTQPPKATWTVGTCMNNSAVCKLPTAENLAAQVQTLKTATSTATALERTRKQALDTQLAALKSRTGPTNSASVTLFNNAAKAYDELKAAAAKLTSATTQLASVQKDLDIAKANTWSNTPPNAPKTASKSMFVEINDMQERHDCSALGQSPVDIDTKNVVTPSIGESSTEPLSFRYMSLTEAGRRSEVQISRPGAHLHVAVPPGSEEWPLGGILSGGVLRGVSYIDIHVPGQHSIDGHAPAAELQLVHESVGGKPAVALSVPLELIEQGANPDDDNEWLSPLLEDLPDGPSPKTVLGNPLALLHRAFTAGQTADYYRYDGSLTKPPCLRTEWFLMPEPGYLSTEQLAKLRSHLGVGSTAKPRAAAFISSLVTRGTPNLPRQVPDSLLLARSRRFRRGRHVQV